MGGEPRELTGLDRGADSAQTLLGAWLLAWLLAWPRARRLKHSKGESPTKVVYSFCLMFSLAFTSRSWNTKQALFVQRRRP